MPDSKNWRRTASKKNQKTFGSSSPEVFFRLTVLQIIPQWSNLHLWWCVFFDKAAGCCFIKNTPIAYIFLSRQSKYWRTAILKNSFWRLLPNWRNWNCDNKRSSHMVNLRSSFFSAAVAKSANTRGAGIDVAMMNGYFNIKTVRSYAWQRNMTNIWIIFYRKKPWVKISQWVLHNKNKFITDWLKLRDSESQLIDMYFCYVWHLWLTAT